jgi:hypothetical protein
MEGTKFFYGRRFDQTLKNRRIFYTDRSVVRSRAVFIYRLILFNGRFYHSPLPSVLIQASCTARSLCSTDVTPLHCYYGPSRHRLVVHPFPGSEPVIGCTLLPPISRSGRGRFLQLLGLSLLSCRLYHPAGVMRLFGQHVTSSFCLRPQGTGSASRT